MQTIKQDERVCTGQTWEVKAKKQAKAQPTEVLKTRLVCNKYKPDATLLNFHQLPISIDS